MSSHQIRLAQLNQATRPAWRFEAVWTTLRAMLAARQTRRLLAVMDDRTLADIGIGRGDAMVEASRPMWDLIRRGR